MNQRELNTEPSGTSNYAALHDGLSDMIEGGRLRKEHIPDDYRWLVETLAGLANVNHPVSDWVYEVANGDTRLGYEEWVQHQKDAAA